MSSTFFDAVIVGGGISGLATAWGLQKRGLRVAVLEAADRVGGTIGTTRADGCLVESGPNSMLETSPAIGQLLDEIGLAGQRLVANPAAKKRFVLRGGRLIPVPMSPGGFFATPLFGLGTKLALVREPFVKPAAGDRDESVADFVRRRLGREFLDYAINPFVSGVYAGDPERLSVRAAFPRLAELEAQHGSLIRGQIAGALERKRNPEKSKHSAAMVSFGEGMQALTDGIAAKLHSISVAAEVAAVVPGAEGRLTVRADSDASARELSARAVVISVPAYAAARLLAPLSATAARELAAIEYPPVAVVVSVYERSLISHPLDGFGFLVPALEHRRILGTIFSSTLFENRGPDGHAVLTTFVGGTRQPELGRAAEGDIALTVSAELKSLLHVRGSPELTQVIRWPQAIPQYNLGHLDRVATIAKTEDEYPGLFLCANWRGGVSVGDCIKSAAACAERVAGFLETTSAPRP